MNAFAAQTVSINTSNVSLEEMIMNIIYFFLPVISAIAVAAVIYAGVLYMTSQGDSDKVGRAKRALLWSIVGIIIVVLSYGIVVGLKSIINTEIIK